MICVRFPYRKKPKWLTPGPEQGTETGTGKMGWMRLHRMFHTIQEPEPESGPEKSRIGSKSILWDLKLNQEMSYNATVIILGVFKPDFCFLWVFFCMCFLCFSCSFLGQMYFSFWNSVYQAFFKHFCCFDSKFTKMLCLIHVCHNSFWSGLKKYGSDAEELVLNMYYLITKSQARHADLFEID